MMNYELKSDNEVLEEFDKLLEEVLQEIDEETLREELDDVGVDTVSVWSKRIDSTEEEVRNLVEEVKQRYCNKNNSNRDSSFGEFYNNINEIISEYTDSDERLFICRNTNKKVEDIKPTARK